MTQSRRIALIAVTKQGLVQARRLRARLRAGEVYRPEKYGPPEHGWERPFAGALADLVPTLFANSEQLVFFLATGAVTRLIAPCLVSKTSDPGVLAVDEATSFVVPLLSGHQGGANAFARTVAGCLGAVPVVTTATDVLGGLSLDLLEETFGWKAEPAGRVKAAAMCLVNHEPMAVVQKIGGRGSWLDETDLPAHVTFATDVEQLEGEQFASILWVTDRLEEPPEGIEAERILWLRPRSLVLGVGCERGVAPEALAEGLEQFLRQHRFAGQSIATIATVTVKADEEAIVDLARANGWEIVLYTPDELGRVSDLPNPSSIVEKCIGTPGVAEPAALLASGAERLLVEKQVVSSPLSSRRMTFALARRAGYQERHAGTLAFVGAGPGDPELLTLKGHQLLRRADVVVYAGSLVPERVLRHAPATATLHNSAHLTLEEVLAVVCAAVRAGKRVVRLHSGDPSLYGAIAEQMAALEAAGIAFEVIPGISSFQAAAAALRSELTVPETVQTVILTRGEGVTPMPERESLEALARHGATLCIFLSARLGEKVQAQLLTAYAPETPVALAYRIGWPDEQLVVTRLDRLAEELRERRFTRTTLILVGKAIGGRENRSRLYHRSHGHIFRAPSREADHPPT